MLEFVDRSLAVCFYFVAIFFFYNLYGLVK